MRRVEVMETVRAPTIYNVRKRERVRGAERK